METKLIWKKMDFHFLLYLTYKTCKNILYSIQQMFIMLFSFLLSKGDHFQYPSTICSCLYSRSKKGCSTFSIVSVNYLPLGTTGNFRSFRINSSELILSGFSLSFLLKFNGAMLHKEATNLESFQQQKQHFYMQKRFAQITL